MVRRRVSLSSFATLRTSYLLEGTPEDARLPARGAYSSERRTAILFAVAVGNS